MGDAIMVLFGAPVTDPDDVKHAMTCAVEMQIAMQELNRHHGEQGLPELFMGVGINTGTVMVGRLGSDVYSEYTVIGDEVNLASRIEAYCLRGQVLIGENTWLRCREYIEAGEPVSVLVKGKPDPLFVREVVGIPSLGLRVPRLEIRRSPRVEVTIPFSYRRVENKIVTPEIREGKTRDMSYNGLLAEVAEPLPSMTDIRLELDLSLLGHGTTDVYAKVLNTFMLDGRHLCGIEFTSAGDETAIDIRRFVQLLLQGSSTK
jgi:adenylate cyclase